MEEENAAAASFMGEGDEAIGEKWGADAPKGAGVRPPTKKGGDKSQKGGISSIPAVSLRADDHTDKV